MSPQPINYLIYKTNFNSSKQRLPSAVALGRRMRCVPVKRTLAFEAPALPRP